MIGQDNDVIHEAVTNSMEILRKESRIWTRKGKLEAYRHAFSSLAPNVRKFEFVYKFKCNQFDII